LPGSPGDDYRIRDRAWIEVSSVVEAVQSCLKDTHKKLLVRELEALDRQGILESAPGPDGGRQIRTHMSLFHLWVQQYIDLDEAVESYTQHRGGKHGERPENPYFRLPISFV
jgi:hypothetical protein